MKTIETEDKIYQVGEALEPAKTVIVVDQTIFSVALNTYELIETLNGQAPSNNIAVIKYTRETLQAAGLGDKTGLKECKEAVDAVFADKKSVTFDGRPVHRLIPKQGSYRSTDQTAVFYEKDSPYMGQKEGERGGTDEPAWAYVDLDKRVVNGWDFKKDVERLFDIKPL